MSRPVIGVLGGMGPEATILLQRRFIEAVDATDDADHIPLLIDMNPQVPSRLSFLLEGQGDDPGPTLAAMAQRLHAMGAAALVMPCNTAHLFAPQIEAAVDIPLLHMPNLAAQVMSERVLGAKMPEAGLAGQTNAVSSGRVGILASPATQKVNLFKDALAPFGLDVVYPKDQSEILSLIKEIKTSGVSEASCAAIQRQAQQLDGMGVDAVLIGCSEFSLMSRTVQIERPVLDTLDVLVAEAVNYVMSEGFKTIRMT